MTTVSPEEPQIGPKDLPFEDLVARHYRAVHRFFRRRGVRPEDADDLTQETFVRIYDGLEQFRAEARFETWMYRVAQNVLFKDHRQRTALKRGADRDAVSLGDASDDGPPIDAASEAPDPLTMTLGTEVEEQVRAAIDTLPPRMGACLRLRVEQHLDNRAIATVLGLSPDTVKAHLFQARRRVRQHLETAGTERTSRDDG